MERGQSGAAYNIGSGQPRSAQSLLEALLAMSPVHIRVERDPARLRPTDVAVIYADNARLRTHAGWQPTVPIQESLRRVLQYWRQVVRQPNYVPEQQPHPAIKEA
jgi:GDP-4-dehydro-6-deoxy-D-mannose reductase